MIKQKPEWAKGERLWEGFTDRNNPSKLDDAYFELFGEAYVENVIDYWADSDSYYALLPKGRVEGFEKVEEDEGYYKYFYSLDPTNKSSELKILELYKQKENESGYEYENRCPLAFHFEWTDGDFHFYEKVILDNYLVNLGFDRLGYYCLVFELENIHDDVTWESTHCNF